MPVARNRLLTVLILLPAAAAALAIVPLPLQCCGTAGQDEGDGGRNYKLLWSLDDTITGWINYRVSVEELLSPDELKNLVCSVVRREKPEGFKYVRIFVYHSVKEYQMMNVDKALSDRIIATYFLNREMIGKKGWELTVFKDTEGREYKFEDRLRIRFNHLANCKD